MSNACSRPVSRCRRGVRALCSLGRDRGAVFATLPNGIGTAANMEASHPEDELRDTLPDNENHSGTRPAAWREGLTEGPGSVFADREHAEAETRYHTLTYEVTGRIARITFDRPERGNAITAETPVELAAAVERADLDPRVHVMVVSGRGKGFCGGYDLAIFAESGGSSNTSPDPSTGTVVDPLVQARNHNPWGTWDPMVDTR